MISNTRKISKNFRLIQSVFQLMTRCHLFFSQYIVSFFNDLGWHSLLISLQCPFRKVFLRLYFNIISHIFGFFTFLYNFFCIWNFKASFKIPFIYLHFALQPFHHDLQTMLQMKRAYEEKAIIIIFHLLLLTLFIDGYFL